MKYSLLFFRLVIVGSIFLVVLAVVRYFGSKNEAKPAEPVSSVQQVALPDQESPESVFAAVKQAVAVNDLERIKQLVHPETLKSLGEENGPRWKDWWDTLKVQMANAEMKAVTIKKEEGVEWAVAVVSFPPREGKLHLLKTDGSWYWAER